MEPKSINTSHGRASFYWFDEEKNITRIMVKFISEDSENEFVAPSDLVESIDQKELAVRLYSAGYKQGRWRGQWEKGKELRLLYDRFKQMMY